MTMPPSNGHTIYVRRIPEIVVTGKRLGRHVRRDSRSAAYPYRAKRNAPELTDQLWTRHIPILDQGNVGSCTGDEQVGVLGTSPFWDSLPPVTQARLNQALAYQIYSDAETIDGDGPYPPNDNGSSGGSAAQVAKKDGYISGYLHITSVTDMADALQEGPLGIGVDWYSSFDKPASSTGLVVIAPGAYIRGGHEVEVRGVKIAEHLFRADNSWGDWGDHGSFEFSWATMDQLLAQQGDCTKCIPVSAPAPAPIPVPADPDRIFWEGGPGQFMYGGLEAWCKRHRDRPDLHALKHDALMWAASKGLPT